jgi:hypothetical protein
LQHFGVEPRGELGIARQIAEQHGKLAALARFVPGRRRRAGGESRRPRLRRRSKLRESAEELLAVPEKHAQLFELALAQQREGVEVDAVVFEDSGVTFETEASQDDRFFAASSYGSAVAFMPRAAAP